MAFEEIENFLKALADNTRLQIIDFMKNGKRESSEIQEWLNKNQSTVSQHLKLLWEQDIIDYEREGAKKKYFIKDQRVFKILLAIEGYISSSNKEKLERMARATVRDTLG